MSDSEFKRYWNNCNVILKECRNELNHAVKENTSPTKYQNFMDVKKNFQRWLKEISDAFDPDSEEKRYFKLFS